MLLRGPSERFNQSIAIGNPERHVRSFAPWQQATMEIMRCNLSIIACSRHEYISLFFAHIPFV